MKRIILSIFALTSLLSCNQIDLGSPVNNTSGLNEDPGQETSVQNLNANYRLGKIYSEHHIQCKLGGTNCFKDAFEVRGLSPTAEQMRWVQEDSTLMVIIDNTTSFDTVEIINN